jgi:hypothetical protein
MANKICAYLAHTFIHRKYVKEVVTPVLLTIDIDTRNPFYEINGTTKREEVRIADMCETKGITINDDPEMKKWIESIRKNNRTIVKRDLGFIDKTDITVAYLTLISAGTTCEIFYTGVILKRPVFLLTDNPEVINHPWYIYSCRYGKICKSLEELILELKKRYGKKR